jgi:uroporphyrinogen-III decarboxylase
MQKQEWDTILQCSHSQALHAPPIALIVDSPWIPGYLGLSTIDYLTNPEIWLKANLDIVRQFPEIIFIPGFWVEMGMAAEPSGFGCRINFFDHTTPTIHVCISSVDQVDQLVRPNPKQDGFMPIILNYYRYLEPRINDAGHQIKIVAARGPLAVAAHFLGVTDFLLGVKLDPKNTHKILKITTELSRNWLEEQASVLHDVEGVLLLDDIVGFLSPEDYLEFAHPYLQLIFNAFPDNLKVFHNDMDSVVSYPFLKELGVDIFNFTHLQPLSKVRDLVGDQICLMGNIPPLDVLAKGTPQDVKDSVNDRLSGLAHAQGFLLSAGGGVSPGTPKENILALIEAAHQFTETGGSYA